MEDVGKMRLLEFAKDMKFRSVIYEEDKVKWLRIPFFGGGSGIEPVALLEFLNLVL